MGIDWGYSYKNRKKEINNYNSENPIDISFSNVENAQEDMASMKTALDYYESKGETKRMGDSIETCKKDLQKATTDLESLITAQSKDKSVQGKDVLMKSLLPCWEGGLISIDENGEVDESSSSLFGYNWYGENVTPEFLQKVAEISQKLGIHPDELMKIMASESRISTKESPYHGQATGLIQFTNRAVTQINQDNPGLNLNYSNLKNMSAMEQLDYVYLYYKPNTGKIVDVVDLYAITAAPYSKAIGGPDSGVVYEADSKDYNNKGLDHDKDGQITKGDLRTHLEGQLEQYWIGVGGEE